MAKKQNPQHTEKEKVIGLPQKNFFRVDEVATYFEMSPRTVKNWIKKEWIVSKKIGGLTKITREEIIRFRDNGNASVA